MIRNIVFDLGNVLLDFKPMDYLAEKYQDETISEKLYNEVFCSKEWIELDRGTLTSDQAVELLASRNPDISGYIKEILHEWDRILTPIEGSIRILKELKSSGSYKLYLLSNFHLSAFERVSGQYDFFKLFDGMVVSSYLKLLKPDQEIFKHVLCTYGLDPKETVFIDDVRDNTNAARISGIDAIQYTTAEVLRKELEQRGLL